MAVLHRVVHRLVLPGLALMAVASCGGARNAVDASGDGDGAEDADDEDPSSDAPDDVRVEEVPASPCPARLTPCGGFCLDTSTNAKNCGACGNACSAGGTCASGSCRDLCSVLEVSTAEDLASLLLDLSWVSTTGVMQYAAVTGDIEILASDLGDGYMFLNGVPGVEVSDPIVYGFTHEGGDFGCTSPRHPSYAYGRMTISAGTAFIAELHHYAAAFPSYYPCPEGLYCTEHYDAHWVGCCCMEEPFDWKVIELLLAPDLCFSGPDPCSTEFAGTDHSRCHDSYLDYIRNELWVHTECVDTGNGHALEEGTTCNCEYLCIDYWDHSLGTCNGDGICRTSDVCPEVTEFGQGCSMRP